MKSAEFIKKNNIQMQIFDGAKKRKSNWLVP